MARKKEERDNGNYKRLAKSKKQHEGKEDADIIRSQLLPLGLQLREVPGDGNCLFRALGDQLDGHMGNHYRHRQDTTNYMMENRSDFQPFVEDDQPFEKHINLLSQLGTYAGNDAIVAFARLHQVAIVIHQPNTPLWQIKGWETDTVSKKETTKKGKGDKSSPLNKLGRQLHIAYHGGDHYDSVRRLGDSGHLPANILMDIESSSHEVSYGQPYESSNQAEEAFEGYEIHPENEFEKLEISDAEREAMQRSGCEDLDAVRQLLMNNCGNVDAAVDDLIELTSGGQEKVESTSSGRSRNQLSRKQLEKIRKQERKRASEARKKHSNGSSSNQVPEETVVIGKVQCLNI